LEVVRPVGIYMKKRKEVVTTQCQIWRRFLSQFEPVADIKSEHGEDLLYSFTIRHEMGP
jgi:hypothetical protein